ncbi:MAG: hypothetical protein Q9201_004770 [Fulgogasparrea decipioides]
MNRVDPQGVQEKQEAMKDDINTVARKAKAVQDRSKDAFAAESPYIGVLNKDRGWEWRPRNFYHG